MYDWCIVLKIRNSGSPAELNESKMPPWPIFKAAVAVNKFLTQASEKNAPPHQRILSLSITYTQSAIIYAIDAIPNENNDGSGGATCSTNSKFRYKIHMSIYGRSINNGDIKN